MAFNFLLGLLKSGEIICLLSHGDLVITASGNQLISWKRGKQVCLENYNLVLFLIIHVHKTLVCMIIEIKLKLPSCTLCGTV